MRKATLLLVAIGLATAMAAVAPTAQKGQGNGPFPLPEKLLILTAMQHGNELHITGQNFGPDEGVVTLGLEIVAVVGGWTDTDVIVDVTDFEAGSYLLAMSRVGGHVKVRNFRQASTAVTGVSVSWSVAVSG